MKVNWTVKTFQELSIDELFDMMALRQKVFVVEQDCPYQDADEKDRLSSHLFASATNGEIFACLRIVPKGISYPNYISIGRVVVAPEYRGKKLGEQLMLEGIKAIEKVHGTVPIKISAQEYLKNFYESLGFQQIGDAYLEDNIPHIAMIKD